MILANNWCIGFFWMKHGHMGAVKRETRRSSSRGNPPNLYSVLFLAFMGVFAESFDCTLSTRFDTV